MNRILYNANMAPNVGPKLFVSENPKKNIKNPLSLSVV